MKKLSITILLTLILSGFYQLDAQKDPIRENFFDAEFFLSEEDYKEAVYSFLKVYSAGYQENSNINYRIGICYQNIPGQKDLAIPYLEKAVKNISVSYKEGSFTEVAAPADALLYLGNAYRIANMLDEAIVSYNSYLALVTKSGAVNIDFTNQQIESCNRAKVAMKNPIAIYKENLGKSYNSSASNFQVTMSGNENAMAYMTSQKFYDAAYFVKKINGAWSNPINITPQIESDGNQYVSSLSFDGNKLFLVRIDNFDGEIFVSDFSQGRWNPSKPVGKPVNSKFFESHASLSPDGKTLYFTSNRTGGLGGMDIYTSTLTDRGEWTEPENLGATVNTALSEETPFIANDGKTLYFSSQGHSTIGGYDIFTSVLNGKTWSEPKPMPYPINSTDDDLFFFPDPKNMGGYMTIYDASGFGNGDLYYIKTITADPTTAIQTPVTEPVAEPVAVVAPVAVPEPVVTPAPAPVVKPEPVAVAETTKSFKYFIKPIFFGFDSYALTDAGKEKLTELVKALKDYPGLKLEVRGHTDAMGPYEYNQILSDKRAKTVTEFLIANGIDSNRLKNTGLSESENVAINQSTDGIDSVEGRKFNRRVEFKIIELGGALLLIEEIPVPEQLKVK